MAASDGRLVCDVRGEVETEDGVLVIRRIHVHYLLQASTDHRDSIERVHDFHKRFCPVYRSLAPAIDISTSFELVDVPEA